MSWPEVVDDALFVVLLLGIAFLVAWVLRGRR